MAKDNKKKNLKQQKQKQKQKQQQTVIVNVLTSKKRRSTKKTKPSSSSSIQQPLIQTLPIQYTPYTMYDTSRLLTQENINQNQLIEPRIQNAIPILNVDLNDIPTTEAQLATDDKYDDIYRAKDLQKLYDKLKGKPFLEDPDKQVPFKNDILDNVEKVGKPVRRSSDVYNPDEFDKGATAGDTSEEEKPPVFRRKNNISCEICGGSYNPADTYSTNKHFDTARHKKALNKLEAKKK